MARTKDRQRALARAKLERQIARRAAAARRRRQIQSGVAAGTALVLVVLGVLWVSGVFTPDSTPPADTVAGDCTWTPDTGENQRDVGRPPTVDIPNTGTQLMTITLTQGVVEATIETANVPCSAASFTFLAGKQYFDNTPCHRLTTSGAFVLQCGDPSGTGSGGPAYQFIDENLPMTVDDPANTASPAPSGAPAGKALYRAGTIAMANSGPNTNGSQFFIVYQDSYFDANYTVLGTVTKGLDVVAKIGSAGTVDGSGDGKPKLDTKITTLTMSAPEAGPEASATPSAVG